MYELREQEYDYFDKIIDKSLQGITRIHNDLILLEGCNAILRKDYVNMTEKVKLISGGKAENELIYPRFVGPGMLTAAVLGNVFSAPSVDNILKVIEEFESGRSFGVLLIVQNYAEYSINFTMAKLRAEAKGYIVKLILINNNNMLYYSDNTIKEQDFLSTLFIYKIAGAMSEEGKNINEIYSLCSSVANNGEIVLLKTDFENINHETCKLEMFSNIAKQVLKPIIDVLNTTQNQTKTNIHETKTFCVGHEVAILISNFGCDQIQGNVFILELLQLIEINGLKVKRIYVKEFITNSSNKGFHICLLNLSFTTVLIKYLDFPTSVSTWPKVLTSEIIETKKDDETKLITSKKCYKNMEWCDLNLQGPIMNHETAQAFLLVISMACEAIIACIKQLNKMDEEYGNGDYGTSLARGAKAIQNAIQENKILETNICVIFAKISHIIQKTIGGLQGGLYSLFFYNIAKAFTKYENDKEITAVMWLNVLITANEAIKEFKVSSIADQTLLTTLTAVQIDFENALNRNMDPIDAFGIAVKTAENFARSILCTQPFHVKKCKKFKYPDPRAHAVGIWMRAAYEGTKLKLTYCKTK